jgi:hypothetical protein
MTFVACPTCDADFLAPRIPSENYAEMIRNHMDDFPYEMLAARIVEFSSDLWKIIRQIQNDPKMEVECIVFSCWTLQMAIRVVNPSANNMEEIVERVVDTTDAFLNYRIWKDFGITVSQIQPIESKQFIIIKNYGYDKVLLSSNNILDPNTDDLIVNSYLSSSGWPSSDMAAAFPAIRNLYRRQVTFWKSEFRGGGRRV